MPFSLLKKKGKEKSNIPEQQCSVSREGARQKQEGK